MLDPKCTVTENDDYKYEYIGKDSPELRAQAAAAKKEFIRQANEFRKQHGLPELPDAD